MFFGFILKSLRHVGHHCGIAVMRCLIGIKQHNQLLTIVPISASTGEMAKDKTSDTDLLTGRMGVHFLVKAGHFAIQLDQVLVRCG